MTHPTLLVPGLNLSATLFRHQIPMLWRHGSVTICDHREPDTIEGMADRLLVDAPPRFALAGMSMGGFIALEVMRRCPERVSHLALISTAARAEEADSPADAVRRERLEMVREGRFDELPPLHYANNVHPDRQSDDALRATHVSMTKDVGPQGYTNQQIAIRDRADYRPILASIECPTLVLVGDTDFISPESMAREMADAIPDAVLVVVPDCGHLSPLEQPDAVTAAMDEWRAR